jgi:D-lactate dehydrogenase (cytochrome)
MHIIDNPRVILRPPTEDDLTDPTNVIGNAMGVAELRADATPDDIDDLLQRCDYRNIAVYPAGGRSSLTGAVRPEGGIVLDLKNLQKIELDEDDRGLLAIVQPGVTMAQLEAALGRKGLFPPAPTWNLATVAGTIACHGNGALGYKYGPLEDWVKDVQLVTPGGETLGLADIPPLNIKPPAGADVPKIAAGYHPAMPVFGSEGTLGVIASATIRLLEQPPTYMAMVNCDSDEQALELMDVLRSQEPEKRHSLEPGGIAAVEYMGERAVELIDKRGKLGQLAGAKALLLVQIEGDESLDKFVENCDAMAVDFDQVLMAVPNDYRVKERLVSIREAVPEAVNDFIRLHGMIKVAADPCVRPEDIPKLIDIYTQEFTEAGVDFAYWGHGEGNIHFNAIPRDRAEVERAHQAVLLGGQRVINMGGTPLAEHGVGKNPIKQHLLLKLYGRSGIAAMRRLKTSLDPGGIMAPGNIFPVK